MEPDRLCFFSICALVVIARLSHGLENLDCGNSRAIGVSNRSIIPDKSMTASYWYRGYEPSNGRLYGKKSWLSTSKRQDFLEIDLGAVHVICGVATQGGGYGWVTQYGLKLSTDGGSWIFYKEKGQDVKFQGNKDRNNIKWNPLSSAPRARYVRFVIIGKDYVYYKNMRVEVYVSSQASTNGPNSRTAASTKQVLLTTVPPPTTTKADLRVVITGAKAISFHSIDITWQLQSKQPVKGITYTIRYTPQGGSGRTKEIARGVTKDTITGLQPYTYYTITITATKDSQFGPTSAAKKVQTWEDAPTCAPTLKSVRATSSTSIHVTWRPLPYKCRNGVLRGYKVAYKLNRRGSTTKYLDVKGGYATTEEVTGLAKYTEYSFQVLAYTVKDGPLSKELVRRTKEDEPEKYPSNKITLNARSSQSIQVSWPRPNQDIINGELKGYTITYTDSSHRRSTGTVAVGVHDTTRVLTSLKKYTWYIVTLSMKNNHGTGPPSQERWMRTLADKPEKYPSNKITLNALSSQSIQVSWTRPKQDIINGELKGYTITYTAEEGSRNTLYVDEIIQIRLSSKLTSLDKYTVYNVSLSVRNHKYEGPQSRGVSISTMEDAPDGFPQNISSFQINATSYSVKWGPVLKHLANGHITQYQVQSELVRKGKKAIASDPRVFNSTMHDLHYDLHGLELCAQYNVSVRAYTRIGPGPYSQPLTFITQKPGPPRRFGVVQKSKDKARLDWEEAEIIGNTLEYYKVRYKGSKSYWSEFSSSNTLETNETSLLLEGLVPGTRYGFWVTARTVCGDSREITTRIETALDDPIVVSVTAVSYHNDTNTVVNVTLFQGSQINGPISSYQVIIARGPNRLPSNYSQALYNHSTSVLNRLSYYITAELPADSLEYNRVLAIGNGNIYKQKYTNVALDRGQKYYVYQRALTYYQGKTYIGKEALVACISVAAGDTKLPSKASDSSGPGGAIGAVFGVLLVFCLVGGGLFYWRRRRNENTGKQMTLQVFVSGSDGNSIEADNMARKSHRIPIEEFPAYIVNLKVNDYASLRCQYKSVLNHHSPWTVAKEDENKAKNRYGNIVAYDHSRVVLTKTNEDEHSDYINSSYIHGCNQKPRIYIATQGPMTHTFDDFWRMVWEQNVETIVMLTNLIELGKRKCHQYWPDDSARYAGIKVQHHKTEVFADYVIRTLNINKAGTSRKVMQFHFIAWPDKGVPQQATSILAFRRKIRSQIPASATSPTVIHCSAGVGRTGAYIMVDALLEQANKEKCVDILRYIHSLRKDRPNMVQTEDQYIFVHLVLYEALFCGNTEIQVHNLRIATQKLATVDSIEKASGYSLEFKRLGEVTRQEPKDDSNVGEKKINAKKNRYSRILPINKYRVVLKTQQEGQEDYINAIFADTHRDRNAFIMTQAPLENTVIDFWKMVMDYDIGTIVMLNNLQEGDEIFVQYWPNQGCSKYGDTEVELLDFQEHVGYVSRKLQVTDKESSRTIKHFQHTTWIDKCVPANPQSVLGLLEEVQRSQQRAGCNAPLLVQCSNGVGRSGTFCAIVSTLERVKQEQVLDVFQTVKSLRRNRPGAVQTLIQYKFCYSINKEYIDSFSDYANFKDC